MTVQQQLSTGGRGGVVKSVGGGGCNATGTQRAEARAAWKSPTVHRTDTHKVSRFNRPEVQRVSPPALCVPTENPRNALFSQTHTLSQMLSSPIRIKR